ADAASVTRVIPRLVRAVLDATGAPALNVLQNNGAESGQAVGHVHFHLIPRRADDGLGYRWNAGAYPAGRVETLRESISGRLQSENE
ncbi:MAG: HIT family protein, partial [Phycisphaerae bacterium]